MNWKASLGITAYLLVYLGVLAIASKVTNQTVGAVLGIVYIFLLIPYGILRLIEYYRTNDGATLLSRLSNALFRVPLALFALVCMVAGGSIIGWVLYNVFIERRKEFTGPHWVFGLGSFGVGTPLVLYGWFTLRSVVRRKENITLSAEEQAEFEHEEDDEEGAAAEPGEGPNARGEQR